MNRSLRFSILAILGAFSFSCAQAQTNTLKVFLLAGQSNCEGHAYAYPDIPATWNVPTIDYLVNTPGSLAILPAGDYTFKDHLHAGWLTARTDAWAVQFDSLTGAMRQAEPTPSPALRSRLVGLRPLPVSAGDRRQCPLPWGAPLRAGVRAPGPRRSRSGAPVGLRGHRHLPPLHAG